MSDLTMHKPHDLSRLKYKAPGMFLFTDMNLMPPSRRAFRGTDAFLIDAVALTSFAKRTSQVAGQPTGAAFAAARTRRRTKGIVVPWTRTENATTT